MKFRVFAFVASLAAAGAAHACIWSYGTTLRGETIEIDGLAGDDVVEQLKRPDTRAYWEAQERKHAARAQADPNHEVRNDHAVTLLHLGRAKEALALLLEIERVRPGEYVTAANLGTAYELAGDDVAALRWITEGIRRNAEAHSGTEWLHVRILNAKIAMAADPKWLDSHSILGIDFGGAVIPKLPQPLPKGNAGKPVPIEDLARALAYQLGERYQFVGPPDRVVARLLFDWANVEVRTGSLETAAALYRESLRYGMKLGLAKARLERVEQTLRDHTVRKK